ncbi:hypothetical protein ACO3UB_01905 [Methanocaldococcus sp. 16A]
MDISALEYIINKSPVVDTQSVENLINNPDLVADNYEKHLKTYIKVDDEDFDRRFVKEIKKGKTVKGYISAPYGYGKTSKALSLWEYCKNNNILSIPPFKFDRKLDTIMDAVYGWTKYVYKYKYPEYVEKIEEIYRKYKTLSIEKEIDELAKKEHLTKDEARRIINSFIEKGKLIISITPKDLMNFLKEIYDLIKEHYDGLAIFVDEVQGINNMEIINDLRNFIFELSISNIGLGILFIIPDYQEEDLSIRAGDLIDRLRKDGFYLNLVNIYNVDFAEKLWNKYGELLGFYPYEIITKDCLRSIGEISSRDDLGKGPRTVIGAFKCACTKYKEKLEPYSVFDFVDDILNGKIAYIQQKYLDALNEGLSLSKVNSEEKRKVTKLLGAFPRGVSDDLIKKYSLYNEFEELSDAYYGTEIVYALEGYTLRGLLDESSGSYVEQHIRKFRHVFDESWEDEMINAFINHLLPEIFPKKKGSQIIGWRFDLKYPINYGYYHLLTGTFNKKYPFRTVSVYSLKKEPGEIGMEFIKNLVGDISPDIEFKFILDKNIENNDLIIDYKNGDVIFKFNVLKRVGENNLPGELKKLQQYVKPQEVTPMFMLCLLDYLDKIKEKEGDYIKYKGEIDSLKSLLIRYLKRFLFSDELAEKYELKARLEKMVEEIFNRICEYKFKDYRTLIHSTNWQRDLERYRILLESLPISKRRGDKFETTKKDLVSKLTGSKNPSVAGFDEECKSGKWKDLIHLEEWGKKDKIIVRLKKHSLEEKILKEFIEKWTQPIHMDEIIKYGMSLGYTEDEVKEILKILESRRYIEIDKGFIFKLEEITNTDVLNKFDEVEKLARNVVNLYKKYGKDIPKIPINLSKKEEILNQKNSDLLYKDLELLESWERTLRGYYEIIKNEITKNKEELLNEILKTGEKTNELKRKIEDLKEDITKTHYALGGIVRHLEEQIKITKKKCNILSKELLELRETITSSRDLENLAEVLKIANKKMNELKKEYVNINEKYNKFKSWLVILRKLKELYEKIDAYKEYIDIDEEYERFNELINEIITNFARDGENYLYMDKDVEKDIELIEKDIKKKESNLRNEFNRIQDEIKTKMNFLSNTLKLLDIPSYSYREPITIEDRDIAYQNLVRNVRTYLQDVLNRIYDYIVSLKTDVEIKLDNDENYLKTLNEIENKLNSIDIDVINKDNIDNIVNVIEEVKSNILEIWGELDKVRKEIKREIIEKNRFGKLKEEEMKIIELLNKYGEISIKDIAKHLNMSIEGTLKCLLNMENVEIIVRKK